MRSEAKKLNLSIDDLERRFGIVAKQPALCERHGEYAAIISKNCKEPSGCPTCADERRKEQDRIDQEVLIAKIAADKLANKLGASLIPRRFQSKTFDQFRDDTQKQAKALAVCKEYAENFRANFDAGRCLLLLGKPGTGKTHLAAAIANQIMHKTAATAVYRTVGGILQHIKGSYDKGSEYTEAEAFASLIEPHLLIIDEVGATKPTEFELATLFNIINGRYEEMRPTIVISNLAAKELPAVLGERCVDRMREGGGIAVGFDWESARGGVLA